MAVSGTYDGMGGTSVEIAVDNFYQNRLIAELCRLVDIQSVSGSEQEITRYIRQALSRREFASIFETVYDTPTALVVTQKRRTDRPLVMFIGHTDTVPVAMDEDVPNVPSRRSGDTVWGRGASDTKGGLAVMVELARWIAEQNPEGPYDFGFCFFGEEELPGKDSLLPVIDACPELRGATFAIVTEPTSNRIQAGCQGNFNWRVIIEGKAGHTAISDSGDNAIHLALLNKTLRKIARARPNPVIIDGLKFLEVAHIVKATGGIASNVMPPTLTLEGNVRYAPNRDPQRVQRDWERRLHNTGGFEVIGNTPGALPDITHPIAQQLLLAAKAAGAGVVIPGSWWTNVASCHLRKIPCVCWGPGDAQFAHMSDERVEGTSLKLGFTIMQRLATGVAL